ncbi:oligodendrocyte-myelin glycoprotein [Xenopus laevis]|uniref:Oligodendrocyte-myelin glycoprotein n=2 Tax=Xenopus laevis TaxID=8355 RepID=A0A1L8HGF6_XENLA|nr:oligodendrocyte-myelin glycoprotein [Xenopus laevis]OCT95168.1 hypothetical protein XELAEV_18012852mg [Xenopus laevis]
MSYHTITYPGLLVLVCLVSNIICICPLKCSCLVKNRYVDCSGRNLTALPHGLQDNVTHLNLSHNLLDNLDHQLTRFSNLRLLDLSHNLLRTLPAHLPRSLWEVYAKSNTIKVLHKLDTAYQWNLKVLDISSNEIRRMVFINNTLSDLRLLNLSSNQLWTVPTNMPYNTQTVDLSNNFLTQILPGTLVRMPKLQKLFLHNNRFAYIPNNAFDQLTNLKKITLHNNPWSCKEMQNITYLLKWLKETAIHVIGYPCANETAHHDAEHMPSITAKFDAVSDYTPVFTTTSLLFLEAQETKLYTQVPFSKAGTADSLTTPSDFPKSTNHSLDTEEGSAHENLNSDFNTFITKDVPLTNAYEIEDSGSYDFTVTLSNSKPMPVNASEQTLSSTTISEGVQITTIQVTKIPSAAHKDKGLITECLILLLILNMV